MFSRSQTILVEYRDGKTETIKRAAFIDTVLFRINNRVVEVNPRRLDSIHVFADTIEIYFGETWIRANIFPRTKDSIPPVHRGFVRVRTRLTGNAEFGRLSASISELRRIVFRPKPAPAIVEPEEEEEENSEANEETETETEVSDEP